MNLQIEKNGIFYNGSILRYINLAVWQDTMKNDEFHPDFDRF